MVRQFVPKRKTWPKWKGATHKIKESVDLYLDQPQLNANYMLKRLTRTDCSTCYNLSPLGTSIASPSSTSASISVQIKMSSKRLGDASFYSVRIPLSLLR